MNEVKLIECPRDAWQGLKSEIPTPSKVGYLRTLIAAGFKRIDAVSFVSPSAVPQMADSEKVLSRLDPPDDVEIIGIVVNERGADRAIATNAVRTLGFPYSVSPTFLQNNQQQTLEESLDALEKIKQKADDAALDVVAYISMAFGNPYGDLWSTEEVTEAVRLISDMDIRQISLADTVGLAEPQLIADVVGTVLQHAHGLEVGVHLHSRAGTAPEKIKAAYQAGARRFDSAIAGLGGCPFAQDALIGNLPTEVVLKTLQDMGAEVPAIKPLDNLISLSQEIAADYGAHRA